MERHETFSLDVHEVIECADALDTLRSNCRVALSQHESEHNSELYQDVERRVKYLESIENRMRAFLKKETGDTYGLNVKSSWKASSLP